MMRSPYFIFIALILLPFDVSAGSKNVLLGENFCVKDRTLCVKGSIDYNYSRGLLRFHGRVGQTRKNGRLGIELEGKHKNKTYKAVIKVNIKGRSFDLVRSEKKTRGKHRDIKWMLKRVSFKNSR